MRRISAEKSFLLAILVNVSGSIFISTIPASYSPNAGGVLSSSTVLPTYSFISAAMLSTATRNAFVETTFVDSFK